MKKTIALSFFALMVLAMPAEAHIFREPHKVCRALEGEGFVLAETWQKNEWQEFACATAYYPLSKTHMVPTNISYYAESEIEDEVTYMYLVLNINDDGYRDQWKAKYVKTVRVLFTQLGITLPDGLLDTIQAETPKAFEEAYGTVSLEIMRGATDTMRLMVRNRRA